ESDEAFAPGLAGALVAGEVVKRVGVVGDLNPTVLAAGRTQKRAAGTGDRPRLAVRGERRPVARAVAVAAARASFVVRRQVERPAVRVDEDPAKAASRNLDGRSGPTRGSCLGGECDHQDENGGGKKYEVSQSGHGRGPFRVVVCRPTGRHPHAGVYSRRQAPRREPADDYSQAPLNRDC